MSLHIRSIRINDVTQYMLNEIDNKFNYKDNDVLRSVLHKCANTHAIMQVIFKIGSRDPVFVYGRSIAMQQQSIQITISISLSYRKFLRAKISDVFKAFGAKRIQPLKVFILFAKYLRFPDSSCVLIRKYVRPP